MSAYIINKDHVALSASQDINEICKPLFENLGANYFNYSRVFKDFSHTSLTSNPEWADFYYKQDYKNKFLYSEDIINHVADFRFLVWNDFRDNKLVKNLNDYFNCEHGIVFIEKGDDYTDFYSFGAPSTQKAFLSFLNNLDLLQNFIFYFKERAFNLIKKANANQIHLPSEDTKTITIDHTFLTDNQININYTNKFINKKIFLENIKVNKYYIGSLKGDKYLTKREMECFLLYSKGYTQKIIANILNISQRTVEQYIKSASVKCNIKYKSEFVEKFLNFV